MQAIEYQDCSADYLVVGAGASGMAFVDTLLAESDATVILIDNRHKPGGHWNDVYSFVTLHQPSSFYGVNSKELSKGQIDQGGLNKGLNELASGSEVQAYFDNVMRDTILPSGRVRYFPMCEYLGNGRVKHLISGVEFTVEYHKKMVDSTYYKTAIPSTHQPKFTMETGLQLVPPNTLPQLLSKAEHGYQTFTVLGGGKTAIDTCLWLLQNQVQAQNITWYMPRDGWLIDRGNIQPSKAFFSTFAHAQACQLESIAESTSVRDMFDRLEKSGVMMRIDKNVEPEMFHGATVSRAELALLQTIKNVVRKGRVSHIARDQITCELGTQVPAKDTLYIDCTASAITNLDIRPVFEDDLITLQTVRAYQPTFSAAFIAYLEISYDNNEKKNQLSKVVPLPNTVDDWVELTYRNMMNQFFWSKEPRLKKWMINQRLDGFGKLMRSVRFYEFSKLKILNRMRKAAKPAVNKLKSYRQVSD
ncbi:NAD(P)-binding protein [Glaciecola sp. SC05]|uniref:NAD(P)-binding protein n=1 Tax=Glaciecola sp. SC05 TaxID=1987355 RepID=UPI0035270F24